MVFTSNFSKPFLHYFLEVLLYLLIALSFVFIANDNTFSELLRIPSFYTDVLFSVTITFGVTFYLKKINTKLDKVYSWHETFKIRFKKQLIWGVVTPLFTGMLSLIAYLYLIDIPFSKSSILYLELPLAFIFLILLNLTSLISYLFKNKQKETIIVKEQIITHRPKGVEYINIQKGPREERIELNNCAFIMSANKLLWLHTFNNEKYRLSGTLEEWEEKLKQSNFYRINRQYLSSFNAIHSVEQTETRKLKVIFVIPAEEVYISKTNVASFRQWWKQ